MKSVWRDVPVGTIIDGDLKKLATEKELIIDNFDSNCVRQACYELRSSTTFWDVASQQENKRIEVEPAGAYLLKPNCFVVCIVMEHLRLPNNVLARVLTKGKLFSIGLLPVNTYADPGFDGRLGITLYNGSKRYIQIQPGERIAKIEFVVLPKPVEHPYSGQHGYETEIWPIASNMFADLSDPSVASLIADNNEEIESSFGPRISAIAKDLQYYKSKVWIQLFLILATFAVLLYVHGEVNVIWSLALGIVANLMTTLGINLWGSWKRSH